MFKTEPQKTLEFENNISESEKNVSKLEFDSKTKALKKISFVCGIISLSFATCAIVLFFTLWILYNVHKMDSILWHPLLIISLVLIVPAMAVGIVSYIYGKIASRITKKPLTKIATYGFGLSLILFVFAVNALMVIALVYSFM